jgi:hypothetical protein
MDPTRGFSLAAIVLLSLVLPLAASAWQAGAGGGRSSVQTVWLGQFLGAVAGLWVVAAPVHPEYGVIAAVMGYLACLLVLRRQMQPTRPSPT